MISIKVLIVTVFLLTTYYLLPPTVHAADSTPSANVQTKLEELKTQIASKAAKLKSEINKKLQNKAYIGVIKSASVSTLTLASPKETNGVYGTKIVNVNQDTVYEPKLTKKIPLKNDDFIAALGDVDETGVLTAKKIILLPTPNSEPKTYLWGQIVSISDRLITLKDRAPKNIAVSLPSGTNVKNNDFVIATGSKSKNDIFEAQFIYVIPQGGILKPKKLATPSAQTATDAVKKKLP